MRAANFVRDRPIFGRSRTHCARELVSLLVYERLGWGCHLKVERYSSPLPCGSGIG